jgi:acyl carrier protein
VTLSAEETRQRVLKVVSQIMGVPVDQLADSSSPDTVERWDSLTHMKLVLALEEAFQVRFSDEQIMAMPEVGRIVATVNELIR